ncbi:MAG: OmpA family protein [Candidatus Omnitrophota bacterium]
MKNTGAGILTVLIVSFLLNGCARTSLCQSKTSPKDFSWWGKSGAQPSPVKDASRGGEWWWPDKPSKGKENTAWGNRGYVYLKMSPEKPSGKIGAIKKGTESEKPRGKIGAIKKEVRSAGKEVEKSESISAAETSKESASALIQSREESELQEVFFKFDSAMLTRKAKEAVRKNVGILKANPALKVTLEGYASPEGPSAYNLRLSEKRATSVKDYLISKEGISADRLTIKSCGELAAETGSYWRSRKVRFVRFIISE